MDQVEAENAENAGLKVLLVDDEDQFRKALSRQLSVRGFTVLDVSNGEDAIKVVRHENPEVVERLTGMIERCREDIGDAAEKIEGKNVRDCGWVGERE